MIHLTLTDGRSLLYRDNEIVAVLTDGYRARDSLNDREAEDVKGGDRLLISRTEIVTVRLKRNLEA